jgi:DNA-binding LacI/PurR family transcriptional regulator
MSPRGKVKIPAGAPSERVSQKALAAYLNLSPSTVSLVLNNAPRAELIPEPTRKRVLEAAKQLDYRPDLYAKYLFTKRSYTVAVMVPEIGEGFSAAILGGIDAALARRNYAYFVANHHGSRKLIREFPRQLAQRAVEGLILINTPVPESLSVPAVSIGNQPATDDVKRIRLNNFHGGSLAMEHLLEAGHRQIAVIKGHAWRTASKERWQGIQAAAAARGVQFDRRLVVQLESEDRLHGPSTPEQGYAAAKRLLAQGLPFTALIAFNDYTAIGAIRAFHDAGLRIPEDVSIIGFDDIQAAAYQIPGLTTLRQPWTRMGDLAGTGLLNLIDGKMLDSREIVVEPELIVRESTRRRGSDEPVSWRGK